jgi:hypothetical protein
MACGCTSSDDEQHNPEEIVPKDTTFVIQQGSDERPTWQSPDYAQYGPTMSVFLYLQPELLPYSSSQDLLCAIVGGEVRGVADFDSDNNGFALTIAGNDSDETISLNYYCDRLHRIFTLSNWTIFNSDIAPLGTGATYKPIFPL